MLFKKTFFAVSAFSAFMLLACSSSSSDDLKNPTEPPSQNTDNTNKPNDPDKFDSDKDAPIEAEACSTKKLDEDSRESLFLANSFLYELINAASSGNVSQTELYSKRALKLYKEVLEKNPRNCDAQFGYATASITNLSSNEIINKFLTLPSYYKDFLLDLPLGSFLNEVQFIIQESTGSRASLTEQIQASIEDVFMPQINTSILYMRNVIANEDFNVEIESDMGIRQIDLSEFGLYEGFLYLAKAILTAIASPNLEADNNGSYSWIESINNINSSDLSSREEQAFKFALSTMGVNGSFGKIRTKWKEEWKSIPIYLDSALVFMKKGYSFSLIDDDQENDLFIVGNYDADLTPNEVRQSISSINEYREKLKNTFTYEYGYGKTIAVNITKLFRITDGIADYLPYYTCSNSSDFSTFYFTDATGKKTASLADFKDHRYSLYQASKIIIFPDPTFGGVFPGATNEKIWDWINTNGIFQQSN